LSKSGAAGLGGSKCQQEIYWIDTIEHESGHWLVPEWLATTCPQMYKPARIIQMDTLAHNLVDYHFVRRAFCQIRSSPPGEFT
jgi:hypothetical protein